MSITMFKVDAFTHEPFSGNPAAVCFLDEPRQPAWMQAVAREMNLSETAFLHPRDDGYGLRWFTPSVEVELCGHATLASAHVLWESERLPTDESGRFHTASGLLIARRDGDDITLDFPATGPTAAPPPAGLESALGVSSIWTGRTRSDYLVQVADARVVRDLSPDIAALRELDVRGVIVTALSDDERYDFISRFFAPGAGVDEDPVTGSTHCALGPFWGERLSKTALVGYQASSRGGVVGVRLDGDRVHLRGRAVTVLRGTLLV